MALNHTPAQSILLFLIIWCLQESKSISEKGSISMPVTYRYDCDIVVVEMVGEYSMDDLRKAILNSLAEPQCPANSVLMISLVGSQSIYTRSAEEVKTVAQFIASIGNSFHNRIALVAEADLPYGLLRMGSVGSEERGIASNVFRSMAEAREWLLA
jgi:hypothetical protein